MLNPILSKIFFKLQAIFDLRFYFGSRNKRVFIRLGSTHSLIIGLYGFTMVWIPNLNFLEITLDPAYANKVRLFIKKLFFHVAVAMNFTSFVTFVN